MSRQQRRHKGKPHGVSYADQLSQKRAYKEAIQQAAKDTVVDVRSQINTQRVMWLMCVAMNDAFGIGPERFVRFAECLQQRTDWYNEMVAGADDEYANEKLRQEAQRCSGIEIEYLYESEILAAKKQHELDLIGNTEDHLREVTKMVEEVQGETIQALPAADVVEVVRCGECRFSETCSRTIELIPRQVQNGRLRAVVHYCEYGERRDNNAAD